jgi:hypothetical protein
MRVAGTGAAPALLAAGLISCLTACTTAPAPGASAPGAALPATAPHPTVAAIVAAISPQRIERRIQALVGFHTRHTLSDTTSDTQGIGAARRWIQREWEACSRDAGGRLEVQFDEYTEPAGNRMPRAEKIVNVVATLPGTDPQARARLYVVSGHYDSRASDVMDASSFAPGANDDASGVAAVMEMACVMAQHRFDATLVFLAVAGEEQGLLGASHWAAQARSRGLQVEGMITNDIVGSPVGETGKRDPRRVRLFADGLSPLLSMVTRAQRNTPNSDADAAAQEAMRKPLEELALAGGSEDFPTNQLGRHLKQMGERYLPGFQVQLIQRRDRYLRGGDHLPFLERGYAAVRFTEPFENFKHQHQDVRVENGVRYGDLVEFVDMAYVADVARINAAGLATLALAPAAPRNARIEALELGHDTTLRWDASPEADVAGYRIVWRETGATTWQHQRDVGLVTRATLPGVSKDDHVFGVQALDRDGHASLASFPLPLRR